MSLCFDDRNIHSLIVECTDVACGESPLMVEVHYSLNAEIYQHCAVFLPICANTTSFSYRVPSTLATESGEYDVYGIMNYVQYYA